MAKSAEINFFSIVFYIIRVDATNSNSCSEQYSLHIMFPMIFLRLYPWLPLGASSPAMNASSLKVANR